MNNKVLVKLLVPDIDEQYDLFIPVNKRIGNIILLLSKAIKEIENGRYNLKQELSIYNQLTGKRYNSNDLVRKTDIRNGTVLILI